MVALFTPSTTRAASIEAPVMPGIIGLRTHVSAAQATRWN
jgi:hypothetical protein